MSTQINQYLMFAILIPYPKDSDSFYEKFEEYIQDSAFDSEVGGKDGIFCLCDGRSGKYVFIGEVIDKPSDGEYLGDIIDLNEIKLRPKKEKEIKSKVKGVFNLEGNYSYYLITRYR